LNGRQPRKSPPAFAEPSASEDRSARSAAIKVKHLHHWKVSYRSAALIQERLAPLLLTRPIRPWPRRVAGVDAAHAKNSGKIFAAVVVLSLPGLDLIEEAHVVRKTAFPYIPGLLTWREGPAALAAFRKLKSVPDTALFDGQGRAHPKQMGIAAHLGLWLDLPTVGCAKSRLIGHAAEPGPLAGSRSPLKHKGRIIGALLRTRDNVKPLYISPGHRANLPDAVKLTLQCCAGFRLPEPTRLAHILVGRLRADSSPQ